MFELFILFSRYLFLAYILYFLYNGVSYILIERGLREGSLPLRVKRQRYTVAVMHFVAFAIMLLRPSADFLSARTAIVAAAALAFIVCAFIAMDRIFKNGCPLLWNGVFFLLDIGFIALYRLNPELAERQLIFAALGFGAALLIPLVLKIIPRLEKLKWLYLACGAAFIASPFLLGSELYGAKNWIVLFGVQFQPSEPAKIFFVLFFAAAFREKISLRRALAYCLLAAVFVIALVLQTDLGGALIFFMAFMAMLYPATGNGFLFWGGVSAAAVAVSLVFRFFPHLGQRVQAWADPWSVIDTVGYQITQSLFAITTWGIFGSGLTRGYASAIPVVERDFIFAAICEEFGSAFGLLLIGVFVMVFYRGVHIALRAASRFHSFIAMGFVGLLGFQTFIILAGTIKLIPMTGVTLPFVSYGGSSVFVCMVMAGLIQAVKRKDDPKPI